MFSKIVPIRATCKNSFPFTYIRSIVISLLKIISSGRIAFLNIKDVELSMLRIPRTMMGCVQTVFYFRGDLFGSCAFVEIIDF